MTVWGRTRRLNWAVVGLCAVMVTAVPFALYAAMLGWRGLTQDLSGDSRLFVPEARVATPAVFVHMIGGAIITALAPLQVIGAIRRRWPRLHRASGYVIAIAALFSATGGLAYIVLRGTIGGPLMDWGFALYGIAVLVAAAQATRHARAGRFERHWRWGLRLFVLAMGSWLYRVHYTIWHIYTDGIGTAPDFSGPFDQVQVFAFYVPYILLLETYFRVSGRRAPIAAR